MLAEKKANTMLLNLLCRVMKLSFQDRLENWLFGKIQILFRTEFQKNIEARTNNKVIKISRSLDTRVQKDRVKPKS